MDDPKKDEKDGSDMKLGEQLTEEEIRKQDGIKDGEIREEDLPGEGN